MNPLNAIIIDDEQHALDSLNEMLLEYPEVNILDCINQPDIAINTILRLKPQVLFLDVQMPLKTGFDVLKEVQSENYKPFVIFTTGFERFALKAIKFAAFDYLLKPINHIELEQTIQKLIKNSREFTSNGDLEKLLVKIEQNKPLKFNTSIGFVVINPSEIIYLNSYRNYCEIYLTNGRKEVVTKNLQTVFVLLPSESFFRISRFNVINISLLKSVNRSNHKCILENENNEITLNISKKYFKSLENFFN